MYKHLGAETELFGAGREMTAEQKLGIILENLSLLCPPRLGFSQSFASVAASPVASLICGGTDFGSSRGKIFRSRGSDGGQIGYAEGRIQAMR